jgi:hypothetical protein
VLVSPELKIPILLFKEDFRLDLGQVSKTFPAGLSCKRKWRVALQLIELVRVCCSQKLAVGPLTMSRCRVANDESLRTSVCEFFGDGEQKHFMRTGCGAFVGLEQENLWTLGLLLFELFFGMRLEDQLLRLLQGDLRPESVQALYRRFWLETETCTSFASFCFPELRDDSPEANAMNTVLCFCMKPEAMCASVNHLFSEQTHWIEITFRMLLSICREMLEEQEPGGLEGPGGPAAHDAHGRGGGWFHKMSTRALPPERGPARPTRLAPLAQSLVEQLHSCGMIRHANAATTAFARSFGHDPYTVLRLLFSIWYPCAKERQGMTKVAGFAEFVGEEHADGGADTLSHLDVLHACVTA